MRMMCAMGFLAALAGCGGNGNGDHPDMGPMQPSLSVLGASDKPAPTSPQTCTAGFLLTQLPRQSMGGMTAAHDSQLNWHFVYLVPYSAPGVELDGLRYVSSQDPTHPQSIAWTNLGTITVASDGTPSVFFVGSTAGGAPTVMRARPASGGALSVDAKPVWTGQATDAVLTMGASIDGSDHTHLFLGGARLLVVDETASGFVETDLRGAVHVAANQLLSVTTDKAGHDFVLTDSAGYFVATNVSGQWAQLSLTPGTLAGVQGQLIRDVAGDVHLVRDLTIDDSGIHDLHLTAAGANDRDLMLPSMPGGYLVDAAMDAAGNFLLVMNDGGGNSARSTWSNASGTWVRSELPFAALSEELLALDSAGKPHFAVDVTPAAGVDVTSQLGVLDPCP